MVTDTNDIRIIGIAGLWHPLLALQNIATDCPANAVGFAFSSLQPIRIFRQYQFALSHKSLKPWMNLFEHFKKELAQIILKDVSLAGRVLRLATDLLPILDEKQKFPLSSDAIKRLTEVLEITKKQSSPKLAQMIEIAVKVFEKAEGKTFAELVKIAAKVANQLPKLK